MASSTPGPIDHELRNYQYPPNSTMPLASPQFQKLPNTPNPDYMELTDLQTKIQSYKDYIKRRMDLYAKKASKFRLAHNTALIIILVGAAIISITVSLTEIPKWIPILISGAVAITTALTNYYKLGERSRDLYRSVYDMEQEYNWFKFKRGPYKDLDSEVAFNILQDRIESLKRDQFQRTFAFEPQKEKQ
jgi:Protein of unknown function (DUF4231)